MRLTTREASGVTMLPLLSNDADRDGGIGNDESEGMGNDGGDSETTGIDVDDSESIGVDVDEYKEGMGVGECRERMGIGDDKCEDTDIGTDKGLGVDTEEGNELSKEGSVDIDDSDSVYRSGPSGSSSDSSTGSSSGSGSKTSYCSERESNTEEFKDD